MSKSNLKTDWGIKGGSVLGREGAVSVFSFGVSLEDAGLAFPRRGIVLEKKISVNDLISRQ